MRGEAVPVARLTLVAAGFALAVTGLVLLTPYLTFGLESPSGHLFLNAVDACVGLLVALLVFGKFLRSKRLQDLLLAQGLALMVVAGLGLAYVAGVTSDLREGTLDVWLPLSVRVAGCLLITAAAVVGDRPVRSGSWRQWAWAPVAAVVAVLFSTLWALRSGLPVAIDLSDVPESAQRPILTGHPLLLGSQALTAVCFLVAAVLFTIEASRSRDPLLRWVGPACVLSCFARVNYVLFPSLYTDWLYTGDVLRTAAYLLLFVGAVSEIQHYWHMQARVAVLDDRRRLARELHDGVIQELAYIRAEGRALPEGLQGRDHILGASERALDEARAALHALGDSGDDPLSASLERAVRQVAERFDVAVVLDLDESVPASSDQRHALVRIAREAVTNAARHGNAHKVLVELNGGPDSATLHVRDDGVGFELPAQSPLTTGYGLVSMRDRAQGLPGSFEIESAPGVGTTVTVHWGLHR